MNTVTISGYVKNVRYGNTGNTAFQLAVSRGKDRNGESKGTMYWRVKVFGTVDFLEGDRVIVHGSLDKFEYNEKMYEEILCNAHDIALIERFTQKSQSSQAPQRQQTQRGGSYRSNNNQYRSSQQAPAQQAPQAPQETRNNPYNDGMNGPEAFESDDIPF